MRYKNNKLSGFTLVELIVVIAIIGILTAILVPSIMGYTRQAKFAAANANAKALLNAGMIACRESDVTKPIPPGIYTKDGGTSLDGNAIENPTLNQYVSRNYRDSNSTIWAIKIQEDVVVAACATSAVDSPYVGTYPHPNSVPQSLSQSTFAYFLNYAENGS